ncbi:hypothetical protein L9F63_022041, partial [Diploptera punctata]
GGGMDKENGETTERGEKGGSGAASQQDATSLLDAASLFAYWPRSEPSTAGPGASVLRLGGSVAKIGNCHHLPGAFAMMGGRGSSGSGFGPHHPPTTAAGSYGSLGTLSVAASQAASLGINPASAAWWTMASHLAAQDYLARLQASAAARYPLLSTPHSQPHVSSSKSSSKSGSKTTTTSSSLSSHHQLVKSLAKRWGTTSLKTTANSLEIFYKIIITTLHFLSAVH